MGCAVIGNVVKPGIKKSPRLSTHLVACAWALALASEAAKGFRHGNQVDILGVVVRA